MSRAAFKIVLIFSLLVPLRLFAIGEQNGRIRGVVTEATSKSPLPGADVTISSPALIGGAQTLQTDDSGAYEFVELPPGVYDLSAGYPGSEPARRKVRVRIGETAVIDVAWSAQLTQIKTYQVNEELHLARPDSTRQGTSVTLEQSDRVATGRSFQDVSKQVAGVSDSDPATSSGNPQIKGGNYLMNRYLVDGLDITDPVTNTVSANLNFESTAAIDVVTGGMEAEYNALGGVINVITKGGSDQFHLTASGYFGNAKFSTGNQYGPGVLNGLRPYSEIVRPGTQSYQANLVVSGPILKQKLWYNVAFEFNYRETSTPAGPPLNLQHPPRRSTSYVGRLKLSWAPSQSHRITLSASTDPGKSLNTAQSNSLLGIAEGARHGGGVFGIVTWDYFIDKNFDLKVPIGFQYNRVYTGPRGILDPPPDYGDIGSYSMLNRMYDPSRMAHVNQTDGTQWYNALDWQDDRRFTWQFDPSASMRGRLLGSHDAKVGLQFRALFNPFHHESPGGGYYTDAGGPGGEAGLCNEATGQYCFQKTTVAPHDTRSFGVGAGIFIQDRWKPTKRIAILPGFRFDWGTSQNTFKQTVSNLFGFGPRLGATFDLTGDEKTIFSLFYGRANETLSLLSAGYADDAFGLFTVSKWDQASKQFVFDHQFGGPNGFRADPKASTPHTDEVNVGLRREVFRDSVASVNYTYKKVSNIWDGIEINQIWNPAGTNVIGNVDGMPHSIFKYTTPSDNYRIYQGVDFVFESRPSQNLDIYVAYTLSWLYGPGAGEFNQVYAAQGFSPFYNPRLYQLFDGFLPEDIRHQLKLRASYDFHGLVLGAFMSWRTGAPRTKLFYNPYDGGYQNRRSPSGTEPGNANDPTTFAEFRTPDLMQVDLRVAYDFHEFIGQNHLMLIADLFNVFDLGTATEIEYTAIPTFGQVVSRQSPFLFQLGLKYSY